MLSCDWRKRVKNRSLDWRAWTGALFCVECLRCSEITVSQFDTAEKSRPRNNPHCFHTVIGAIARSLKTVELWPK